MKTGTAATIAIALFVLWAAAGSNARAGDTPDVSFAKRMFAGNVAEPKSYACFVRRYDAEHMIQHPLQKVSVMKILITSEKTPDDKYLDYSFRLGVNFRNRPGNFDSSGQCGHAPAVRALSPDTDLPAVTGIDFNCGVDCDGGGLSVELAKDDGSVIVKLDSIRIWKDKDPDESAMSALQAGADDKIFRLDRAALRECTALVADRHELATMRHK